MLFTVKNEIIIVDLKVVEDLEITCIVDKHNECIGLKTNIGKIYSNPSDNYSRLIFKDGEYDGQDFHRVLYKLYIDDNIDNDIIHHINGNHNDNRLCNLESLSRGNHARKHHTGAKRSEETRSKMRQAQLGKRHSSETKAKLSELFSGENNPNYGKPRSPETCNKISESNMNGYATIHKAGISSGKQQYAIQYYGKLVTKSIDYDYLTQICDKINNDAEYAKYIKEGGKIVRKSRINKLVNVIKYADGYWGAQPKYYCEDSNKKKNKWIKSKNLEECLEKLDSFINSSMNNLGINGKIIHYDTDEVI